MQTNKTTKRALLGSLTSLLLCFAMLIGSTFAWFTDSASTSVNKIEAGTLNVALKMATAWDANGVTTWDNAEGQTLNFIKASGAPANEAVLWEPGATYKLPEIKIVNEGNLALKYKVDVIGATGDFALANVLDVKTSYVPVNSEGTKGTAVTSPVTTLAQVLTVDPDGIAYGKLAAGESIEVSISMQMQTSAGNEYRGRSIEGIAILVRATQDTVEYDSEGNTYDEDAGYSDVQLVRSFPTEAVSNSNVVLGSDLSGTPTATAIYGNKAGFILNGGTLDGKNNTITVTGRDYGIQTSGGTTKNLTVKNAARGIVLNSLTEDVFIDNVTIENCGYGISTAERGGHKMSVTNSVINGWTSFAGLDSAKFTSCSFGTSDYYSGQDEYMHAMRPYVTTTYTNCTFDRGFYILADSLGTNTITLDNCTCGGVKLTKDNILQYVKVVIDNDADDNYIFATGAGELNKIIFK